MEYMTAVTEDLEEITNIVQDSIQTIYLKYYPKEVVDFFLTLHNKDNIAKDINQGLVGILKIGDEIVGTGCYHDTHITRVYVKPQYQRKGYGSYIMQCLEDIIGSTYDTIYLDASLPASLLYEKLGYKTIQHKQWPVENDVILVYEIMEKTLTKCSSSICYDGKFFTPYINTENGEVDETTIFSYHQHKNILWAEYAGGDIQKGYLLGTVHTDSTLDFYYHHLNTRGEMRAGVCRSIPHIMKDGSIELQEEWRWLNGDKSKGSSILHELKK